MGIVLERVPDDTGKSIDGLHVSTYRGEPVGLRPVPGGDQQLLSIVPRQGKAYSAHAIPLQLRRIEGPIRAHGYGSEVVEARLKSRSPVTG